MNQEEKLQKLKNKAIAGLSNPEEVKDEDVSSAIDESDSIVGDKILSDALYLDIAYYRFLGIIGSNEREEYESLYKMAIKELKLANTLNKKYFKVKVKQRDELW